MASFTERQEHQLEIIPPYSIIQCRRADIIEKDGVEVGKTYHRHTRTPGEDVSHKIAKNYKQSQQHYGHQKLLLLMRHQRFQ
jgi:hypothetical protein